MSRDRKRFLHAKVACESRLRAVMYAYNPAPVPWFSELDRNSSWVEVLVENDAVLVVADLGPVIESDTSRHNDSNPSRHRNLRNINRR